MMSHKVVETESKLSFESFTETLEGVVWLFSFKIMFNMNMLTVNRCFAAQ